VPNLCHVCRVHCATCLLELSELLADVDGEVVIAQLEADGAAAAAGVSAPGVVTAAGRPPAS
jgi:hypothetical protein